MASGNLNPAVLQAQIPNGKGKARRTVGNGRICVGGVHPVLQVPGTVAPLTGLQERTIQAHLLNLKGFTKIAQQTILYMNGIYRGNGISVFPQLYVSQYSFAP